MRRYIWTAGAEVTEHIVVQHIDEMTGKVTGLVTVEKVEKPVMRMEEVPVHHHKSHKQHHNILQKFT